MLNDNNRVVQGLWVGGRLSALERLCILSFCANGHEFHLYHYDELRNVPQVKGLRVLDAQEILPRTAMFGRRTGIISWFADHFQYELLRQRGGWWADMDTVCLRPLDFSGDIVIARPQFGDILSIAIMKFPRAHPAIAAAADCYRDVDRFQPWDTFRIKKRKAGRRLKFWRDSRKNIGPDDAGGQFGFMRLVRHFGLEEFIQPTHVFHMLDAFMLDYIFTDTLHEMDALAPMLSRSYCVHFSNSWLNKWGFDKDGKYPEHSLYEILKRRYPGAEEDL